MEGGSKIFSGAVLELEIPAAIVFENFWIFFGLGEITAKKMKLS